LKRNEAEIADLLCNWTDISTDQCLLFHSTKTEWDLILSVLYFLKFLCQPAFVTFAFTPTHKPASAKTKEPNFTKSKTFKKKII